MSPDYTRWPGTMSALTYATLDIACYHALGRQTARVAPRRGKNAALLRRGASGGRLSAPAPAERREAWHASFAADAGHRTAVPRAPDRGRRQDVARDLSLGLRRDRDRGRVPEDDTVHTKPGDR